MNRLLAIALAGAALAGCADAHLGDGYGRRTRTAMDAQIQNRGELSRAIDGEDAKAVLSRHRGLTKDQPSGGATRPGAIIVPTNLSTSSSSSGYTRDMPPPGAVRLDAVR